LKFKKSVEISTPSNERVQRFDEINDDYLRSVNVYVIIRVTRLLRLSADSFLPVEGYFGFFPDKKDRQQDDRGVEDVG